MEKNGAWQEVAQMTSDQSLLTVLKLASVPLLVLLNGFLSL